MSNVVFNEYKYNLVTGAAAITDATTGYAVMLVTSGYSPNEGDTWANISAYEISATSAADPNGDYERKSLTSVTVTSTGDGVGTDDYIIVDAADTTFGNPVTISAAGAVIYKIGATSAAAPASVVNYVDFNGTKSSNAGEFTVVWNANGILNYKQGTV